MIILPLAAILLASADVRPAYPTAQVLSAFGDVCRGIDQFDGAKAEALASAWVEFTPQADSPLGQLVDFGITEGRKMLANIPDASMGPMVTLRREVAGEELFAVLSQIKMNGGLVNGCRVYDVGETRQLAAADAEKWTGRPPSRTVNEPGIVSVWTWEPGYAPGHDSFELFYVPQGSPAVAMLKVTGITLKADFAGRQK